jgi:hypothetical protein
MRAPYSGFPGCRVPNADDEFVRRMKQALVALFMHENG